MTKSREIEGGVREEREREREREREKEEEGSRVISDDLREGPSIHLDKFLASPPPPSPRIAVITLPLRGDGGGGGGGDNGSSELVEGREGGGK